MTNNSLDNLTSSLFHHVLRLEKLSLDDNQLKVVPTEVLKELPNLQLLRLGGNLIERIEEDSFPLKRLKSLDLSHNPILEVGYALLYSSSSSSSLTIER